MPQLQSLGAPQITGATPDELRVSVQFWMQEVFRHLNKIVGARGTPTFLNDVNANNHNIVNLPAPSDQPVDDLDSMAAVPRKFATPLVRQPNGSFAWDCRFIPMINDSYAEDMTGVPPLQQVLDLINDKLSATLPAGIILLWSGAIAGIPSGWTLCDGTLGTPDLRGRFIPGAGGTYVVNATGGTDTLNLAHVHSADGTLATDSQGAHIHSADGTLAAAAESAHTHTDGSYATGTPSATTTVDNDLALSTVAVASSAHTHDVTGTSGAGSAHTHDVTGDTSSNGAHTHDVTGDTDSKLSATTDNRPAFYALAYIMKL